MIIKMDLSDFAVRMKGLQLLPLLHAMKLPIAEFVASNLMIQGAPLLEINGIKYPNPMRYVLEKQYVY